MNTQLRTLFVGVVLAGNALLYAWALLDEVTVNAAAVFALSAVTLTCMFIRRRAGYYTGLVALILTLKPWVLLALGGLAITTTALDLPVPLAVRWLPFRFIVVTIGLAGLHGLAFFAHLTTGESYVPRVFRGWQ